MRGAFGAFAYGAPEYVVALVILVGTLVVAQLMYWLGRRAGGPLEPAVQVQYNVVQSATLGLIALVLGFSFSVAAARYDGRRQLLADEVNAIGTAYLRSALLDSTDERRYREILREYTAQRVRYYTSPSEWDLDLRNQAQLDELEDRLFSIAVASEHRAPQNLGAALLLQSTNQLFDIAGRQRTAIRARAPAVILLLLFLTAGIGAALIGFALGSAGARSILIVFSFVVVVTLVVDTVVDLDRPEGGTIRLDFAPLQAQLNVMH